MNLVELAVLVGVAGLGFTDIEPINLEPLAPMGWGPFIPAMALIYISYVGFELISNAAEEIIQPGKNIPRAILITLGISTSIYVFVVGVMMGTVNYTELAGSDIPFIFMAERLFGAWGRWAGVIATIMASLSAFSVTLGASARILYALGRDRHFPYFFSKLHPRFQTPHIALFICAVIVIIFSSSGIVKFVASLSDFGYLMGLDTAAQKNAESETPLSNQIFSLDTDPGRYHDLDVRSGTGIEKFRPGRGPDGGWQRHLSFQFR